MTPIGGACKMARLRMGIIGLEHPHVRGHSATIAGLRDKAELVALTHDDPAQAEQFARKFGMESIGYEALLNRKDIDAVLICKNSTESAQACVDAANAGKHIMCEKPLGISVDDTEKVLQAVRKAGVLLQVAFTLRFDRLYIAAEKLLSSGAIGTLVNIWSSRRHRSEVKPFWGGGETLEHGVHDFDLLRWYAKNDVTTVFACGNTVKESEPQLKPVDHSRSRPGMLPVEDTSVVTLRFSNNVIAGLNFGTLSPMRQPYWADATLELIGTNGLLRVSMTQETLTLHTDEGVQYPRIADGLPPKYKGMYLEFFNAIAQDREPSGGLIDGVMATRIAAAAYDSMLSGKPESISPISTVDC